MAGFTVRAAPVGFMRPMTGALMIGLEPLLWTWVSCFSWRVQSRGSLGANAAKKGDKNLQNRRQMSLDIELL